MKHPVFDLFFTVVVITNSTLACMSLRRAPARPLACLLAPRAAEAVDCSRDCAVGKRGVGPRHQSTRFMWPEVTVTKTQLSNHHPAAKDLHWCGAATQHVNRVQINPSTGRQVCPVSYDCRLSLKAPRAETISGMQSITRTCPLSFAVPMQAVQYVYTLLFTLELVRRTQHPLLP